MGKKVTEDRESGIVRYGESGIVRYGESGIVRYGERVG